MTISGNYTRLREEIPDHVTIVVAGKTRSVEEIIEAVDVGATDIGENYVQEAEQMRDRLAEKAKTIRWHMIGHLQTNKINRAIQVFDVVQTVDSMQKAIALDTRVEQAEKKVLPIFIEINIGSESAKAGIRPNEHEPFEPYMERLVKGMCKLTHIRVDGLMTMGPRFGDPEGSRPYFRRTRQLFDRLAALGLPAVQMRYLSMGMTNSYRVAIEEGANMVRIGTAVFGPRPCDR
ncbi:MAG: YggS family pyridoxal phosphate enzyme [Planctomycetes bacterium RBG_13_60_9]|nr:MAG: YggS family pyridoxal phosphate enzyme [Planctomycetes bacterium RBG_13_60_9]